uniref:Vestigial like family member 4 n=1 Tax=Canis lupus familiaris TaxID=9615 RepID=A0A8C0TJ08_CANLF
METPLDVLSRAASLVHADDEKREAALRGEPRMQTLPVASALTSHRTGPPPISPSKRKFSVEQGDDDLDCENDHASKMSRIFNPHLNKTANGDCRKDPRERSRSPIERAVAPTMSLHGNHLYTSLPSLSMEQPLALTKNSMDASRPAGISPTLTPVERQQNRPSVITCASASTRNCNLSHCPIAHSGCVAAGPASYRRAPSCKSPCGGREAAAGREGRGGGGYFFGRGSSRVFASVLRCALDRTTTPGACSVEAETVVVWSTWHVGCVWLEWDREGASRIPPDLGQALFLSLNSCVAQAGTLPCHGPREQPGGWGPGPTRVSTALTACCPAPGSHCHL